MGLKQLEPVVEKLGDYSFYITPFPAFKAANLSGELASTLTPLLSALVPLLGGDGTEEGNGGLFDIDASKAASAIGSCAAIDGNKIEKLAKECTYDRTRRIGSFRVLDYDDIVNIYKACR